jgi:hypothetical protein
MTIVSGRVGNMGNFNVNKAPSSWIKQIVYTPGFCWTWLNAKGFMIELGPFRLVYDIPRDIWGQSRENVD